MWNEVIRGLFYRYGKHMISRQKFIEGLRAEHKRQGVEVKDWPPCK